MEWLILGINLLGLFWIGWRVVALANFVQSTQAVDPKSLQRSVKDTIKTQIAQNFSAPVDVAAFIEHTIKQLPTKRGVETHSNMEYEIVRYIAGEVYGAEFVDAQDIYEKDKHSRNLVCKASVFKILNQEKVS